MQHPKLEFVELHCNCRTLCSVVHVRAIVGLEANLQAPPPPAVAALAVTASVGAQAMQEHMMGRESVLLAAILVKKGSRANHVHGACWQGVHGRLALHGVQQEPNKARKTSPMEKKLV